MGENLSEYVKRLIDKHPGLSYRQASEDAGLSNSVVNQIINGTIVKPKPETLRRLASKWGSEEDFLTMMAMAGHLKASEQDHHSEEMSALEAERVISALRKMTAEQREAVIRYVLERARGQSSE